MQVLGVLIICLVCPLLGGLPLIAWMTRGLTGKQLQQLGTGNVSVSAAFYHGGRWVGILAVLSEAFKGIAAVLLARYFFPEDPMWELVALIALVLGRYWMARGAGTTNVVWGFVAHDWITAALVCLLGGIGFTILRERYLGRIGVLVLLVLITMLRHPDDGARIGATVTLSLLIGWIYQKIPDDLDLPTQSAQQQSRQMFRFFRGDRALISLDQSLSAEKVGQKAATLSQLRRWGYPVPMGWVLPPGDDPLPLVESMRPSAEQPLIVRSSAIGEDSDVASAAGQYLSIAQVTDRELLIQAIAQCQMSYNRPAAVQYRRDRGVPDQAMAVLVQDQIQGSFSGVAFSRDPIQRSGDAVVVEALPGGAAQVVSGQRTPEQYQVWITEQDLALSTEDENGWVLPDELTLPMEGEGDLPPRLIQQVAYLARHLEARYHGIPQDIEWSYDGQQLWVLQSRPITTLLPIWTRKIAAEVIPGFIPPLTWSINRPLTCGVWGTIFALVLGDRADSLDFNETATLHHSAAYFNASLLGEIFRRMGLPAESLEFLTRGAKFSKPPLLSTLRNVPGLLRLLGREFQVVADFEQDNQTYFQPSLLRLKSVDLKTLSTNDILDRIEDILDLLQRATYYSILAPLSLSLRQAILRVGETELDNACLPEVASVRSLKQLAQESRPLIPNVSQLEARSASIFTALAENPDGQTVIDQLDRFLDDYGYLSEVATDIAVPTWREDPQPVRELFAQLLIDSPDDVPALNEIPDNTSAPPSWRSQFLQPRMDLKGQVTEVYSRFLAELRWSFIALAERWQESGCLQTVDDIFFLTFPEVCQLVGEDSNTSERSSAFRTQLPNLIAQRRSQLDDDQLLIPASLVYGNDPPQRMPLAPIQSSNLKRLQGIGASPGEIEGRVLVLRSLQAVPDLDRQTILVVPYTDSGWSPLLARCGGLIAEVGGRLSHGAIVAREYGIPAVMDIQQATLRFQDGQRVRINGTQGIVEIL